MSTSGTWAPSTDTVRQFLVRSDFLKDVPSEAIDELARIAVPRELAPGDKVWHEGEGLYFAIICRGQLEVRKDGELIDIMLPYQAFGHSALLGKTHTATMIATIDSHVLRFDAARVFTLTQEFPSLMIAAFADVLALVAKLNRDVSSAKASLRQQLRYRLRWLSRDRKPTRITITQKQLAALTGSNHCRVSRELGLMEDSGAIRRGFKSIEIIDLDLDA